MSPCNDRTEDALDAVLARSTVDRAFRDELLIDPRRALYRVFGVQVPEHFRLRFIERDPNLDALIVLPDFRDESDSLSDADLEAVTGGAGRAHDTWSGALRPNHRHST